jgi:hypothetical protein
MADMPQYMNKITAWDLIVKAYDANVADLSFMTPKHEKLVAALARFRALTAERAALTARKQEVAKEMRVLFREGETLVDALRTTAREHYGLNNEKLVEFGIKPNRPRSRNAQPVDRPRPLPDEPEAPEIEAPEIGAAPPAPDSTK